MQELITLDISEVFHHPTRPTYFKTLNVSFLTQSEVNTRVVVGEITPSRSDLGGLRPTPDFCCDPRPDRVSVALPSYQSAHHAAHQPKCDPMISVSTLITQQAWTVIKVGEQDIHISIIIVVAKRSSSA